MPISPTEKLSLHIDLTEAVRHTFGLTISRRLAKSGIVKLDLERQSRGLSGGHGNNGIAGLVKQTPYSIGYVELAYAISNKLTQGRVQNKEGEFVKASLESVTAAAAEYAQDMPESFRVSITDAPGRLAYPISSFTWLLVPEKLNDKNKLASLRDFLKWALTDGQKLTDELMYAPLPAAVIAREEKILSMLQ